MQIHLKIIAWTHIVVGGLILAYGLWAFGVQVPYGYAFAGWIFSAIVLMFGYSFLTSGWKCLT